MTTIDDVRTFGSAVLWYGADPITLPLAPPLPKPDWLGRFVATVLTLGDPISFNHAMKRCYVGPILDNLLAESALMEIFAEPDGYPD